MSRYKKTPIGLLPEEWHIGALEDFGEVVTGSTPSTKDPGNFGNDYMFITPSDINGCKYIRQSSRGISKQGFNTCRKIPPNSVVFVCIGSTIGKVAISTQDCATNQQINAVVPRYENDAGYIFYYLQLRAPSIAQLAGKQAVPIINKAHFSSLPIPIPDPVEQRAISAELDKWDFAIEKIELLIAEKRLRRKGLMQQLLTGKRRLPGFGGKWRVVRLGNIFHNRTESARPDLPLVSIAGDRGVIPRDEIDRKDISNEDKSKYLRICPGDIGYNTMRMWQGVSGLSALEGIVSPAYTIVTPKEGIDGEFMAILFKFQPVVHLFYRHSQGMVSDTWNLKFRHFAEIKVTIPDKEEQKAIAKVFQSIDRELNLLQANSNALREQKKGLMQQLLTGKKRVKV